MCASVSSRVLTTSALDDATSGGMPASVAASAEEPLISSVGGSGSSACSACSCAIDAAARTCAQREAWAQREALSLIHISEPTRRS
eukprot:4690642-Prymnesium_polylepis.1